MGASEQQPLIYYMEPLAGDSLRLARELLPPGMRLTTLPAPSEEEHRARLAEAEYMIVAMQTVDDALLAQAPRLRLIQQQGVGYNNLDLDAARARGIPVALNPAGLEAVAEHAVMLMLLVLRQYRLVDEAVRRGEWPQWDYRMTSGQLIGRTVGIIGFGRIGRMVARLLKPWNVTVLYNDIVRPPADVEAELGARFRPLDDLLAEADVVTLHVPLYPDTRGLIGRRELALMKKGAILVNTARGPVVDREALVDALTSGHLAGAGLDVTDPEPPPADDPLRHMPNVYVTPHVATGVRESFLAKVRFGYDNILRAHRGEPVLERIV